MNCYRVLRGCMFVVLFLASFIPFQHTSVQAAGAIWYVKADASGANTGTSWADAFTDLHAALSAAGATDQIWVAKGVYKPSTSDKSVSFELKDGVALYGGFAGSETSLEQRDVLANPTVLSGDIDQNDTVDSDGITNSYDDIVGDNSRHVVTGHLLSSATVLDGFTITGGENNTDASGSGIYILTASPILNNLTLIGHKGLTCSALSSENGSPQLKNSRVIAN
jgi:hypothetical protein